MAPLAPPKPIHHHLPPAQKPTNIHCGTHTHRCHTLELTGHPPVNKPKEDASRHKQPHNTSFLKPSSNIKLTMGVLTPALTHTRKHGDTHGGDTRLAKPYSYETLTQIHPSCLTIKHLCSFSD